MTTTRNEIVYVVVLDEIGDRTELYVPAFVRLHSDLDVVARAHLARYLDASIAAGEQTSLGDFALYLLTEAAKEPRLFDYAKSAGEEGKQ